MTNDAVSIKNKFPSVNCVCSVVASTTLSDRSGKNANKNILSADSALALSEGEGISVLNN